MPTYTTSFSAARATRRVALGVGLALGLLPASVTAQAVTPALSSAVTVSASELVAQGDRESAARRTTAALGLYERAVEADPRHYAALWKAAQEAVDLGEFERAATRRTDLYARATAYATRAMAVNASDAEGHFHLARALGRTALALGPRERVKYAVDVRSHALEALRLMPRHAGALHVMGVWHAEVMRLNGLTRAVARTFMGGQVFSTASWGEAIRNLEQAVALEPNRLVHHLDLARIYRDAGRTADARSAYAAALRAPLTDANDGVYRLNADDELRKLR
ncbi:MAG: tetratricopeptide repeat protein [Gemmatimonadaceae bacterium]